MTGLRNREVCCEESVAPDPKKISNIQAMTGSQYLVNKRFVNTRA
jgi:hypothetical protein